MSASVKSATHAASKSAKSAISSVSPAAASASLAAAYSSSSSSQTGMSRTWVILTYALGAFVTALLILLALIYLSGNGDDVARWWAKRYYRAKAVAEIKVLENTGSEKVEGMVKESLRKNPVADESELDQVPKVLDGEAVQQGLGGISDGIGGLRKR